MAEDKSVKFCTQIGLPNGSHITPNEVCLSSHDPFKFLVPLQYLWKS